MDADTVCLGGVDCVGSQEYSSNKFNFGHVPKEIKKCKEAWVVQIL